MSLDTSQLAILIVVGVLLLALVIWLVMRSSRKVKVVDQDKRDVLDEGADRAGRNQALIDSPRSVEITTGPTSAAANADPVAAAGATADAEAGASVSPTITDTAPSPGPVSGDDLRRIKGVGPKLVVMLDEQGVTSFAQIAAWTEEDIARVDATLGRFAGRIERDQWVEQAKLLAAGDDAGFEAKFGANQ